MTSPLKQQRNASSNNPMGPVLISWQSPIPLPLTSLLSSPTVMSPLSLAAGDLDTSPVVVPAPAMVQPNTTIPAGAQAAIENSSDRVECAVNAGYSPASQWNTLLAEIKANAAPSLTGSNGLGSISNSDMKCPTPPLSLPSTTDTGLPLPTDLISKMNDALALLFENIDKMDNNTAATTDPEFPLDLMSYPQFDSFSTWLNDHSPIDNQALLSYPHIWISDPTLISSQIHILSPMLFTSYPPPTSHHSICPLVWSSPQLIQIHNQQLISFW
ncbi:uncharacterized protein BJ212DRAFT_1483424 [Suillus subaureus]|uniref:Uncharacterized protein n=1 Tax=Suillus subaureus TaxID=48587 RepID=A0A9P7E6B9_9AGAM|nr:uncharacterized protein BJ212DRAFT_1483424 [Suillus subaureus]KAG1812247.1 hypothetical protein BJ212DRAFT_1483424 [Suillus subaureus]